MLSVGTSFFKFGLSAGSCDTRGRHHLVAGSGPPWRGPYSQAAHGQSSSSSSSRFTFITTMIHSCSFTQEPPHARTPSDTCPLRTADGDAEGGRALALATRASVAARLWKAVGGAMEVPHILFLTSQATTCFVKKAGCTRRISARAVSIQLFLLMEGFFEGRSEIGSVLGGGLVSFRWR